MKRSAEKQLTRDGGHSDGEDDAAPGVGIQKADGETLARRPMKGLPKRLGGTPTPPMVADSKPAFKFGDTSNAGASAAFTFNSPTSASSQQSQTSSPFSSSAKSSAPLFTSTPVAASASSATKAFASFLDSSSQAKQINAFSTNINGSKSSETEYYSCLRGLNLAALAAVKNAIQENPFTDLNEVFERYKSIQKTVKKELDNKPSSGGSSQPSSTGSLFGAGASSNQPTMPKPVQSFSFGASSSSSSSPFGTSAPSSNSTSKQGGFAFTPTPPKGGDTASKPAGGYTFTPTPASSNKPTSAFGGSIFGKPPSESASAGSSTVFVGGSTSATPIPSSMVFGGNSASTVPSASSFGKTSSSTSSTSIFGGSSSSTAVTIGSTTTTPNPFGKPANLSSSVAFTFGTPPAKPEADSSAKSVALFQPSGSAVTKSDSAGAPSALSKALSPPLSEGSRGVTPMTEGEGDDAAAKPLGTNPHDEEGEGEEDEETVHSCRVKVYKMVQKDGQPQWADFGVGFLRLKKHKSTDARRMLARNSANGKVMLNFNLYSGLTVTRNKNVLSFIGHEDGKKATFRVKVKDEAGASALKQAIDSESANVKSRESSVAA